MTVSHSDGRVGHTTNLYKAENDGWVPVFTSNFPVSPAICVSTHGQIYFICFANQHCLKF